MRKLVVFWILVASCFKKCELRDGRGREERTSFRWHRDGLPRRGGPQPLPLSMTDASGTHGFAITQSQPSSSVTDVFASAQKDKDIQDFTPATGNFDASYSILPTCKADQTEQTTQERHEPTLFSPFAPFAPFPPPADLPSLTLLWPVKSVRR